MRGFIATLLALLPGCATRDCTPPEVSAVEDTRAFSAGLATVAGAMEEVHVLVLSGGGSHGAWGAGVLNGWAQRPVFNVVTGVSTGALLATHAFLGEPEVLRDLYTNVSDRDIYRQRFILAALFSDSLASLAPLERLIARHVTDETIDRVAAQGRRKLYVATVDLDHGETRIWDLTAEARAKRYDRYRSILLASSSVPGLYPPVMIDGSMHVDGGVREQLFVRRVMLELCRKQKRVTVHVLVNGKLGVGGACVQPRLLDVALRGVAVLASASAQGNLLQSRVTALENGAAWRMSRIPEEIGLDFDSQHFPTEGMRRLFYEGVRLADQWEEELPRW